MGMSPKISLVTISYNQGRFLEECIKSVIEQGYPPHEYIVVDPGSTDGSRDIVDRYRSRITAVVFEKDNGPADGLNKGFSHATGDILGFINADDRLVPGALAYVRDYFARNPNVDVLGGAIRIIDEAGAPSMRKRTSDRFRPADYAAGTCTICQQATFFRRAVFLGVGGFNRENRISWDGELMVDMAMRGAKFATVNKVLGDFRVYRQSITGSGKYRNAQLEDLQRIRKKMRDAKWNVYGQTETAIRRVLYKINPVRHLAYLLAR